MSMICCSCYLHHLVTPFPLKHLNGCYNRSCIGYEKPKQKFSREQIQHFVDTSLIVPIEPCYFSADTALMIRELSSYPAHAEFVFKLIMTSPDILSYPYDSLWFNKIIGLFMVSFKNIIKSVDAELLLTYKSSTGHTFLHILSATAVNQVIIKEMIEQIIFYNFEED